MSFFHLEVPGCYGKAFEPSHPQCKICQVSKACSNHMKMEWNDNGVLQLPVEVVNTHFMAKVQSKEVPMNNDQQIPNQPSYPQPPQAQQAAAPAYPTPPPQQAPFQNLPNQPVYPQPVPQQPTAPLNNFQNLPNQPLPMPQQPAPVPSIPNNYPPGSYPQQQGPQPVPYYPPQAPAQAAPPAAPFQPPFNPPAMPQAPQPQAPFQGMPQQPGYPPAPMPQADPYTQPAQPEQPPKPVAKSKPNKATRFPSNQQAPQAATPPFGQPAHIPQAPPYPTQDIAEVVPDRPQEPIYVTEDIVRSLVPAITQTLNRGQKALIQISNQNLQVLGVDSSAKVDEYESPYTPPAHQPKAAPERKVRESKPARVRSNEELNFDEQLRKGDLKSDQNLFDMAQALGVTWTNVPDPKINRMRCVMAVKKYYGWQ